MVLGGMLGFRDSLVVTVASIGGVMFCYCGISYDSNLKSGLNAGMVAERVWERPEQISDDGDAVVFEKVIGVPFQVGIVGEVFLGYMPLELTVIDRPPYRESTGSFGLEDSLLVESGIGSVVDEGVNGTADSGTQGMPYRKVLQSVVSRSSLMLKQLPRDDQPRSAPSNSGLRT